MAKKKFVRYKFCHGENLLLRMFNKFSHGDKVCGVRTFSSRGNPPYSLFFIIVPLYQKYNG